MALSQNTLKKIKGLLKGRLLEHNEPRLNGSSNIRKDGCYGMTSLPA